MKWGYVMQRALGKFLIQIKSGKSLGRLGLSGEHPPTSLSSNTGKNFLCTRGRKSRNCHFLNFLFNYKKLELSKVDLTLYLIVWKVM